MDKKKIINENKMNTENGAQQQQQQRKKKRN